MLHATYANAIFDNYSSMNSFSLALGAVYFAFQIYGDFSGYSIWPLGMSKALGSTWVKNFNYPYFSRDMLSSGGAGIFRYRLGFVIICTFRWEEVMAEWR
jgi:D-alanyl-lipoteichoic acid acyltransferase DltB (MBOAT superfamily)